MEWTSTSLRVLRAVAEYGSFSAAAAALGYTQSAVSRQVAALEKAAGAQLFVRRATGARVTPAGQTLLHHASTALDEVDRATRVLQGGADEGQVTVRLGFFASVGPALIPGVLSAMRARAPHVEVITREVSTPALVAGLRAATLDLAVLGLRPPYPAPDDEDPPLVLEVLLEGELLVAVPADSSIGRDGHTTAAELAAAIWVSSPRTARDPSFGVWPALQQRPLVRHEARDWLSKLTLVSHGFGVTTIPPYLTGLLPANVRAVQVDGEPVKRRASIARLPEPCPVAVDELLSSLRSAARGLQT